MRPGVLNGGRERGGNELMDKLHFTRVVDETWGPERGWEEGGGEEREGEIERMDKFHCTRVVDETWGPFTLSPHP